MPRYERDDLFWEIDRDGRRLIVRAGRIGEPVEQVIHTSHFEHEAMVEFDDRIAAKLEEGFHPVEQPSDDICEIPPRLQAAVVEALDPARIVTRGGEGALEAAWSIVGDWLSARGDVRGELISLDIGADHVDRGELRRLYEHRDAILTEWIPRWLGEYGRLDGRGPMTLVWQYGHIAGARIGTEPGALDLSRWRLGLRDLVPVLMAVLTSPLVWPLQLLRIAELDPRSRRDLKDALPLLQLMPRPALVRLELGSIARGRWARDVTGNFSQKLVLTRIGSLAPLALASRWAPRLVSLRIVGRELRVFPPLPQLRAIELLVAVIDEDLRDWLTERDWPKLERLWIRCADLDDPWNADELDAMLEVRLRAPLRELGLQGRTALDRISEYVVANPIELDELRLYALGESDVDALLEIADYLFGVERLVLADCEIRRRWDELQRRYGRRLYRCDQTFGVVAGSDVTAMWESVFDDPTWS